MKQTINGNEGDAPKKPEVKRSPGSVLAKHQAKLKAMDEKEADRRRRQKERREEVARQMAHLQAQARRREREQAREDQRHAIRRLGSLILDALIDGQAVGASAVTLNWSQMSNEHLALIHAVVDRARSQGREPMEEGQSEEVPPGEPQVEIDIRLDDESA